MNDVTNQQLPQDGSFYSASKESVNAILSNTIVFNCAKQNGESTEGYKWRMQNEYLN